MDDLDRLPGLCFKAGAPRFMTPDNLIEAPLQNVGVQRAEHADRNALDQAYHKQWPEAKPGQRRNNVTQLWSFRERVRKDDLIFVRSYGAIIGIGEVQGDYDFVPATSPLRKRLYSPHFDDDYPHIRRVRWLSLWGGLKQSLAFTRLTLMP